MLYSSDFNGLLARWDKETKDSHREQPYKDAVRDCIYDLRCMIDDKFAEEMLAQEAWEQQMADNYLATIEAHDRLYV